MDKNALPRIGYARDAVEDPDMAIQLAELARASVPPDAIFMDRFSRDPVAMRSGFAAMVSRLQPGVGLVIWRLDRLGRDLSELVQNAETIRAAGAELISLSERIDSTKPKGRAAFEIISLFSRLEADMVRERTRSGYGAHLAQQKRVGRRASITDEKRAEIISHMLEGRSFVDIAKRVQIGKSTLYNNEASLRAEAAIAAAGRDSKVIDNG